MAKHRLVGLPDEKYDEHFYYFYDSPSMNISDFIYFMQTESTRVVNQSEFYLKPSIVK